MRIAVVGAGMGGLAFASAMRNHDAEVIVYEQAPELAELGAGISLFANATRLFDTLGIASRMAELSNEPGGFYFRDEDGSIVACQALGQDNWYRDTFGNPYYGALRRDLQSSLLEAVGPGNIRLGKQLVGLEDAGAVVRLEWADGTTDVADLVVAADGIKSIVRPLVCESEGVRYTGTSAFRGLVRTAELTRLPDPHWVTDWMGDGKHVLNFPVGKDYELTTIVVFIDGPETWPHAEWRVSADPAEMLAGFDKWHPAVGELLQHVNFAERWGMFEVSPLPAWHRGRLVLLGDAAHGMMPHHGQGANSTFEDAVALARVLADDAVPALDAKLAAYEAERKPRAERIQQVSRAANDCLHLAPGPQREARRRKLNSLPEQFAWLHNHGQEPDVPGMVSGTASAAPASQRQSI